MHGVRSMPRSMRHPMPCICRQRWRFIEAGKHILCEKPLAPSYPDALEYGRRRPKRRAVVNMVNFTYRNSPALHEAHRLVAKPANWASFRHLEAEYLQSWLVGKYWGDWRTDEKWLWRLSRAHGSTGVLGDVGVHILDFATYCAGETMARLMRISRPSRRPKAAGLEIICSTPTTVCQSPGGWNRERWRRLSRRATPPATPTIWRLRSQVPKAG